MSVHDYANGNDGIPFIDYGEQGPFRCSRCKAYVNPYMKFIENGAKAVCNLCSFTNDVPLNY